MSMSMTSPSPAQPGHMPVGRLNENASGPPTAGVPARENSNRSSGAMSVAVPTVDREPPPRRRWSTTTTADRCSIMSTLGWP